MLDIAFTGALFNEPASFYDALYQKIEERLYNTQTQTINDGFEIYVEAIHATGRPAFESFFVSRGLEPKCAKPPVDGVCWDWEWNDRGGTALGIAKVIRRATAEFALLANPQEDS